MHKKLRTVRFVLAGALVGVALVAPALSLFGLEGLAQEVAGGVVGGAGVVAAKIANIL